MDRALSLHIGVNQPRLPSFGERLTHSEANAWRMAGLAHQAGYRSLRVLLGREATQQAVHEVLAGAASTLRDGDTLFVSFSGHGIQMREVGPSRPDEREGLDEAWCLSDSEFLDDKLVGYWRLFDPGVRILMVTESCYGGGMDRWGNKGPVAGRRRPAVIDRPVVYRGEEPAAPALYIRKAPADNLGIRASLLMLSACREDQLAHDGLFSCTLFEVWNEGRFDGTFYDLYQEVRDHPVVDPSGQEPRIAMVGAADPEFPRQPAFRLKARTGPPARYR